MIPPPKKIIKITHLWSHLFRQRTRFFHITCFFLCKFFHTTYLVTLKKHYQTNHFSKEKKINYIPFSAYKPVFPRHFIPQSDESRFIASNSDLKAQNLYDGAHTYLMIILPFA